MLPSERTYIHSLNSVTLRIFWTRLETKGFSCVGGVLYQWRTVVLSHHNNFDQFLARDFFWLEMRVQLVTICYIIWDMELCSFWQKILVIPSKWGYYFNYFNVWFASQKPCNSISIIISFVVILRVNFISAIEFNSVQNSIHFCPIIFGTRSFHCARALHKSLIIISGNKLIGTTDGS